MEPSWPFAWSLKRGFYLRPDGESLLFCACDEEGGQSLVESVTPGIEARAADLILAELPELRRSTVRKVWSCFRTKTPDDRFVIGPDPLAEGVFWVAGLGGHGVGCSWEVGRLAASLIAGPKPSRYPFDPERLTRD